MGTDSRAGWREQASNVGPFGDVAFRVADIGCKRARQDSNLDIPRRKSGSSIHLSYGRM